MENDETAALIDTKRGLHKNNLYTLTINDDPVIQKNCCFVQFDLAKVEAHILEEENAYCLKQLIEYAALEDVFVSLILYSETGKPSDIIRFRAKLENFTTVFSWENTNEITKYIITLTPL